LQAKENARKEEEAKKECKKDDSALTDIETCSDSESPRESGEVSQGISNSVEGLLSGFSEATVNITESTSSMVLEDIVYGLFHETEPTSFSRCYLRIGIKRMD
jgi:hypothetical protein